MSVKMTAAFGAVMLLAMGAVDYQAAANARPEGQPLSLTAHILDRVAQAREAVGLSPPPATPETTVGQALAAIEAALKGSPDAGTDDLTATIARGDTEAASAVAEAEFAKVAKALDEEAPAARETRAARPGAIKVGIGTCKKSEAGKFCSVKPEKRD